MNSLNIHSVFNKILTENSKPQILNEDIISNLVRQAEKYGVRANEIPTTFIDKVQRGELGVGDALAQIRKHINASELANETKQATEVQQGLAKQEANRQAVDLQAAQRETAGQQVARDYVEQKAAEQVGKLSLLQKLGIGGAAAGGLGGLAALSGGDSETPPVVDQPVADPSVMDQIKQGASDAYQSASDAVSGINPYVASGALAAALASGAGALYLRKKLKEQRG